MMAVLSGKYEQPADVKSKFFLPLKESLPSLEGKVVAITGCTSGTGLEMAKCAAEKGAVVLLMNRPSERAENALKAVQGLGKAVPVACDLSKFASVRQALEDMAALPECAEGLDVLCNNAGIMADEDNATEDGCDIQMQVNHLSHFILCQGLMPLLEKAAEARGEARIVNHSSIARKGPKVKAANLGKNGGNLGGNSVGAMPFSGPRWERYQQTKAANYVFTMALHDRLAAKGSKVRSLCAHPGYASTELQVHAVKRGSMSGRMQNTAVSTGMVQSGEDGACGICRCSFDPEAKSGEFYGPIGMGGMYGEAVLLPVDELQDPDSKTLLWTESEKSTGITFSV